MSERKPVRQLVRIKHGSHLYGTSTPASDTDYKGVHLPSGQAILLGRPENVINSGVTSKLAGTDKNSSDAVDSESYSLQKFFEMLAKGDTVATEILFAPQEFIVEADPLWPEIQEIGKTLLNRKCKGFVGYCRRQAAKYGIKGSRMAAVKKLVKLLEEALEEYSSQTRLETLFIQLAKLAEGEEHLELVNIPTNQGANLWHIRCCDRSMPMTATLHDTWKVYNLVWKNYGERARAAMDNEGIDWKAVSHAVRVAEQAIELLTQGRITFPRPNAPILLEIKQGQLPYSRVSNLLEELVAKVEEVSESSDLPATTPQYLIDASVEKYYGEQVLFESGGGSYNAL